jgi:hypothetical protein
MALKLVFLFRLKNPTTITSIIPQANINSGIAKYRLMLMDLSFESKFVSNLTGFE